MRPPLGGPSGHRRRRLHDLTLARSLDQELAAREWWSRLELQAFQQERLTALVQHATRHSAFYREIYGTEWPAGPVRLEQLPVVDKPLVMENFDRVVTDSALKLDRLQAHLRDAAGDEHYLDAYHALETAGSSGRKGTFVVHCAEWAVVIAAWFRSSRFMEIPRQPGRGVKFAAVAGGSPIHTTFRLAASLDVGIPRSLRLDVTAPLPEIVAALNDYQPEMMMAYPSMASILAGEQLEGRLRIHPQVVVTAAEWRTEEAERAIIEAWGVIPFNHYGTSEGPVGIDCTLHRGIHLFEDLCIVEAVDTSNRPVPPGTRGDKILFTNLFNHTQPLIRYEISDLVTVSPEPCQCGRAFPLVRAVEGRLEDVFHLESLDGGIVPIHSNHFVEAMAGMPGVERYRVLEREDGIDVLVMARGAHPRDDLAASIVSRVRDKLERARAVCPTLRVRFVEEIRGDPRATGKLKLVESVRSPATTVTSIPRFGPRLARRGR